MDYNKFVPFIQLIIASWIADLLGWIGAPLALAGIHLTYDQTTAPHIAAAIVGLGMIVIQRIISHFNLKVAHLSPAAHPDAPSSPAYIVAPSMVKPALTVLVACLLVLPMVGCVSSAVAPTTITDASGNVTTLTTNDQKAYTIAENVIAAAPLVRPAVATIVGGVFTFDPSLANQIGVQTYGVSHGVYSLANGQFPTPDDVENTATSFTDSSGTVKTAKQITSAIQGVKSAYAIQYNNLMNAKSLTTNKAVLAIITQASIDLVQAVAGGVMDATLQYAPTIPAINPAISWNHPWSRIERLAVC